MPQQLTTLEIYTNQAGRILSILPPEQAQAEIMEVRAHLSNAIAARLDSGDTKAMAEAAAARQFGPASVVAGRIVGAWLRGRVLSWADTLPGALVLSMGALKLTIWSPYAILGDWIYQLFYFLRLPEMPAIAIKGYGFTGWLWTYDLFVAFLIGLWVGKVAPRWSMAALPISIFSMAIFSAILYRSTAYYPSASEHFFRSTADILRLEQLPIASLAMFGAWCSILLRRKRRVIH